MIFVLFSGPPGSGKDTGARIAYDYIEYKGFVPVWEKFSFPNKRAFAGAMNVKCDEWGMVEEYESKKSEVVSQLGVSYRQWQIDFSEKYMKQLYGDSIFASLLRKRCLAQPDLYNKVFVVSDCGFQVEVDYLPNESVIFFDMYRNGCDYSTDSRGRVKPKPDWVYHKIENNRDIPLLTIKIEQALKHFL